VSQYGEGEYPDVYDERWMRARKEHVCCACSRTIQPGEQYHYTFMVYEGTPDHWKRCERCQAIFAHLSRRMKAARVARRERIRQRYATSRHGITRVPIKGPLDDDLDDNTEDEYCDPELNCGHEYEERWKESPPPEIAALAFWLPGDPLPSSS
jgi:hypothetical protein